MRILDPTLVVKVHDFFESFEAPVMHIRCGSGDLPQGRRLKRPNILGILADHIAPEVDRIGVPPDPSVVEFLISEVEPGMALRAPCFLPE